MLDNAAVHLRDCTAAPVGTVCSRARFEIASELYPQSNQGSKRFGYFGQVLPITNMKLFVLFTVMLDRETVGEVNVFEQHGMTQNICGLKSCTSGLLLPSVCHHFGNRGCLRQNIFLRSFL